jgi:hypothetical protein
VSLQEYIDWAKMKINMYDPITNEQNESKETRLKIVDPHE